jgi:alpha-mannosidase
MTGTVESRPEILLVPHTHWDREWYQPFADFRERLVQMMDGLIEILDRDPGFAHFHLDGQVAMVDDYLEVRPEREADIRRLAAAGRISLGPWYTQADEFLVSGETIIRNLEAGLRRARELGGGLMLGYLPDQFGHIGQMPQLLRQAGIERALVWRGVPQEIDRSAFVWESPDGSQVRTEYLVFGYGLGWHINYAEDAEDLSKQLENAIGLLRPLTDRDRLLVTVGGDHQLAQARLSPLLEEVREAGGPHARLGSLEGYLDGDASGGLPAWRGELRSAARAHLLPNVYSNRVNQKRRRAQVEALVERYAEPLAALVPGFEWPAAELERAWRLLLWNGAHDSVCGCSVDQVARDVDARYAEAESIARTITREAMAQLGEHLGGGGTLSFNPSPFERGGVPGLGWHLGAAEPAAGRPAGVAIAVASDHLNVEGFSIRLLDEPDIGDLYTFCPDPYAMPSEPDVLEAGEGWFRARYEGMDVEAQVWRPNGAPFVVIGGVIDNRRPDHRLRLLVYLFDPASTSVAWSPFELVTRPLRSEGSDLEWASPTWPARGAVAAGGVALLHEGVFEYEVVDGRELAVTLLRCVGTISRQHLASRPSAAGPDIATPDGQMIGRTEFRIALLAAPDTGSQMLHAWEQFALPIITAETNQRGSGPRTGKLLDADLGDAMLSSIRRVDGGIEARVWNPLPAPVPVRLGDRAERVLPRRIETFLVRPPERAP